MDDTQKMLRTIINGQSAFRQEVMSRIDRLDEKFEGKIDSLDKKMDRMEKNLTGRIDKLGRQLAYLEDNTPTREEFDSLEKRVVKMNYPAAELTGYPSESSSANHSSSQLAARYSGSRIESKTVSSHS